MIANNVNSKSSLENTSYTRVGMYLSTVLLLVNGMVYVLFSVSEAFKFSTI